MMMCMFNFFLFSMVFKREENYQNTPEKIFKKVQAYINFLKLLNYQGMMMYMFKILFFNGFQKWSKLPKYRWNIRQKCICIHEFSKTTKLPMNDDVYVSNFLFNGFQMLTKLSKYLVKQVYAYLNCQKLLNYQWMMMYMILTSFFKSFQK